MISESRASAPGTGYTMRAFSSFRGNGAHEYPGTPHSDDGALVDGLESVHDLCLVRASQAPWIEAVAVRGNGVLGHRVVRVPAPGARQPHRLFRHEPRPAEDPAGSHHARGVRTVRGPLHGRGCEDELPLCRRMPDGRGLLHFPEL